MSTPQILIVEDEPNIIEALTFLLKREGCEISVVGDGEAALDKLLKFRPDMIVLDVMLPKLDGFEVLKQIKSTESLKSIPILVLSAKGQEIDRQTALNLGAEFFISKPFCNQEVIGCVKQGIEA